MNKELHYKNIDFLRFLFAVLIIYYHCTGYVNYMCGYQSEYITKLIENCSLSGACIINAFFTLSGFFLFLSFLKKQTISIKDFIINKFFRLWPTMAFSFLLCFLIGQFNKAEILNLFFISSGMGLLNQETANAASWYICVLFFFSIFFFCILKNFSLKKVLFICSIFAIFSFDVLCHAKDGHYCAIVYEPLMLTAGMVRALGCMSIGIICAAIWKNIKFSKINNKITNIIIGIVEGYLLGYFVYYMTFHHSGFREEIYYHLIFLFIFFLFLIKKGFVSNLLNSDFSKKLGSYSYSMYVLHLPVMRLYSKFCSVGGGASS